VIRLDHIDRRFHVGGETVHALRGVDLQVLSGEYVSVMGPSGSGKSTLLNIIGLLDRPDGGVYRLEAVDTTKLSDREQAAARGRRIGFIFQFFHLIPRLTAAENVELPLTLASVPPSDRRQRVAETLERLDLSDRAQHRPDQLSGGQRQRVAIARAIVMKPAILLADEPTGNLDRASGSEVVGVLETLNRQGLTVIMVTHDPEMGRRASRRVQMDDGRVTDDTGAPA
jgi:putative ABC transport system ATP-binding protein